jgi:PPOX class probable F420-dependent enzyme
VVPCIAGFRLGLPKISKMSEQPSSTSDQFSIDTSTDFGARAARHLREDPVAWLTTVSPTGAPTPNPVWFLWDGAGIVRVFSMPTSARVRHLQTNRKVALNFAGDGRGGDIVVLSGVAAVNPDAPKADELPEYLTKYGQLIPGINMTPDSFAAAYSVPIVITLNRLRGD